MNAKQFTDSKVLEQIGSRRLEKFLAEFSLDFTAANLPLPSAESENGSYFDSVAALLQNPGLPGRVCEAVSTLETAALPENEIKISELINRRIPCVGVSSTCALDRVLELWFQARDELGQFARESGKCQVSSGEKSSGEKPEPGKGCTVEASKRNARVDGKLLLDALLDLLRRFAVLPKWAAEALALWIVHTFAFQIRNVTTYIGIESPEMRCGKTTLLTILGELVNRPIAASNISPSAFFRVIEELGPTLLIDEVDTFLKGNDQLGGILNAGYKKDNAYVWRVVGPKASDDAVSQEPNRPASPSTDETTSSQLARFSCWCPKVMAKIGRFPATLADRCIIIRMHRKTHKEQCERISDLKGEPLRQQCAQFAQEHCAEIASSKPQFPSELNDRSAEIWEPLFAIADIAGGDWPQLARQAAINLTAANAESNPIGSLLLDIYLFFVHAKGDRLFTRDIVATLNTLTDHPWTELSKHKEVTEYWLSATLRPYGIRPKTIRIGEQRAKGYLQEDFKHVLGRYVTKADLDALVEAAEPEPEQAPKEPESPAGG